MAGYRGWYNKATRKMVDGDPPQEPKFGEAPFVSMGTIRPQRHPMTGEVIDSVRKWDETDRITGCHTSGTRQVVKRKERSEEDIKRDLDQAMERAINDIDNGTAPLSEEMKAACAKRNEEITKRCGFDAFNALGKKNGNRRSKAKRSRGNGSAGSSGRKAA